MSQTEQQQLLTMVMEMQKTMQFLMGKVGVEVKENDGKANGPAVTNRDEAVVAAEHNYDAYDASSVKTKPNEVAELLNVNSALGLDERVMKGIEDSELGKQKAATEGVSVTFGGFKGKVPPKPSGGFKGIEINGDIRSESSSLTESDSVSWSDLVEEEMNEKGASQVQSSGSSDKSRFFKDYVKISEVRELRKYLTGKGVTISKGVMDELALSRFTTGTVPVAFANGRARIKALALVGDKMMTAVLADGMYRQGKTASEIQEIVSRVLTRTSLSPVCVDSGLGRFIVAPSGIDLRTTSVGGEALETIAGVVFHSGGLAAVEVFMKSMKLM